VRRESKSRRAPWRHYIVVAAMLFSCQSLPGAQEVSDQAVKAAYLYNFAKFVEWPAGAFAGPTSPIRLCLLNGDPLESDLRKTVEGKSIANHPVAVVLVQSNEAYRDCHVLFLGSASDRQSKQILEFLNGACILTVGDSEEFAKDGGIIRFLRNKDRVEFEVNHKAAQHAQLSVSSRLLRVAKAVTE
jgi:hypothetical protein